MSTNFPELDFAFRRGLKQSLASTAKLDGTFNICKDTRELFIDVDSIRFKISDVIYDGVTTEAEIKAIESPELKLYVAADTMRILVYNPSTLTWTIMGGDHVSLADSATKATCDGNGNTITSTYQTIELATTSYNQLNTAITDLTSTVGNLAKFKVIVIESGDLPDTGVSGYMYFVNESAANNDSNPKNDIYACYIWIVTDDIGGYFVKIGTTSLDLSGYYTKTEVDTLLDNLHTTINASIASTASGLQTQINALNTKITDLSVGDINTKISDLQTSVSTLSAKNTEQDNEIAAIQTKNTEQDTAITNIQHEYLKANQTNETAT